MAIYEYTENTGIIAALPDDPNDSGGLSSAELKAKFDENAANMKTFLNDSLIAQLNATTSGTSGADHIGYGGNVPGSANVKAAIDKIYEGGSGTIPPDNTITTAKIVNGAVLPSKCGAGFFATAVPWQLIQSYPTAGTYTWVAPDLLGTGDDFEIGVYLIGGGGSGAAGLVSGYVENSADVSATGGASGYARAIRMICTPGEEKAVVVGAGGTAVTTATGVRYSCVSGHAGGSTSFAEIVIGGGEGGLAGGESGVRGANGGQGSDCSWGDHTLSAPAMGEETRTTISSLNKFGGYSSFPDSFNPFDLLRRLGAGGKATASVYGASTGGVQIQSARTLNDGLKAGDGNAVFFSTTPTTTVTAGSATSPGSGGGAAASGLAGSTAGGNLATSGAGADGAVFIYARRLV